MVIFDVGGHEGEFIGLFRKLFPDSQVHSFEPDAINFKKIFRKFGIVSGIYLNPFGIGEENTRKTFYRNILSSTSSFKEIDFNSKWTQVKSKTLGVKPTELVLSSSEVQIKPLDEYAKEHSIDRIHILKIDAEGYELKCLNGCKNLLKNNLIDSIQLEVHFDDMYKDHYTFQDLESFLGQYNYRLYLKKPHFLLKCHEVIFRKQSEEN